MEGLSIRPIAASDRDDWLAMWAGYCAFYRVDLPARVSASTWRRVIAADSPVRGLIACGAAGAALGFAHYVVHPYTWSDAPACYLEDLFVRPAARGRGTGAALITHLLTLARSNGWPRVYWMTQASNAAARRLYDRFTACDDFVRYVVDLEAAPARDGDAAE